MKKTQGTKEQITVTACMNADGMYMPPFIILLGQQLMRSSFGADCYADVIYTCSPSGWQNEVTFMSFLERFNAAVNEVKIARPVILFCDGYKAHVLYGAAMFCLEKKIILYTLLSHATHLLQPLDVGVFSKMKTTWSAHVMEWMQANEGEVLKKTYFSGILKKAWEDVATKEHSQKAFQKAGLCPFTEKAVDYSCLLTEEEEKQKKEQKKKKEAE